jgi:hypothetical protein
LIDFFKNVSLGKKNKFKPIIKKKLKKIRKKSLKGLFNYWNFNCRFSCYWFNYWSFYFSYGVANAFAIRRPTGRI